MPSSGTNPGSRNKFHGGRRGSSFAVITTSQTEEASVAPGRGTNQSRTREIGTDHIRARCCSAQAGMPQCAPLNSLVIKPWRILPPDNVQELLEISVYLCPIRTCVTREVRTPCHLSSHSSKISDFSPKLVSRLTPTPYLHAQMLEVDEYRSLEMPQRQSDKEARCLAKNPAIAPDYSAAAGQRPPLSPFKRFYSAR